MVPAARRGPPPAPARLRLPRPLALPMPRAAATAVRAHGGRLPGRRPALARPRPARRTQHPGDAAAMATRPPRAPARRRNRAAVGAGRMSDDIERGKQIIDSGIGAFNTDPDPAVRLANWHNIARAHISVEMCERLARNGFPELAEALLRQRGDVRGATLTAKPSTVSASSPPTAGPPKRNATAKHPAAPDPAPTTTACPTSTTNPTMTPAPPGALTAVSHPTVMSTTAAN